MIGYGNASIVRKSLVIFADDSDNGEPEFDDLAGHVDSTLPSLV